MTRRDAHFTHGGRCKNHNRLARMDVALGSNDVDVKIGHMSALRFSVNSDLQALGFLDSFVDATHHVERLLRQVVVLTVDNAAESTNGFLQVDVLAR